MKGKDINISGRKIGNGHPIFVIAEAGVNHNGSLKLAKKLIDAAKRAGADAIKFQAFITEELVTENAPKAVYQKKNVPEKSQYEMLKALELSETDIKALFAYCQKKKIIFLSTPFDIKSADFLFRIGVTAFKISSGDLTNLPFLEHIAKYKKPIILSTGMATLQEVKEAVKKIYASGNRKLVLLHCTSNYPTEYKEVNLKAMETLRKAFRTPVGYSDHTMGIEIAIAAAVLGASIIEKHITLDKIMSGPDHLASIDPAELKALVTSIKNVETSLGSDQKHPVKSELKMKSIARRSIVAAVDIPKRARLEPWMLTLKRPGTGIEPKYIKDIIGKYTNRKIFKNNLLGWNEVCL